MEYDFYLIDKIPDKDYLEKNNYNLKKVKSIKIFGCDFESAKVKLKEKGIKLNNDGEEVLAGPPNKKLLCETEGTIDRTIFRAIAKIAFNYLAFGEGKDLTVLLPICSSCKEFLYN